MSSTFWTILLVAVLGVVTAGAAFIILAFLALFFVSPFTAAYEDYEEHAHAHPARKPSPVGTPVLHH
jgi:hypothetical protein